MNIVVKTASGHCVVRPDTSWVRKNDDLYLPDFAGPLSFSPIVYAHVSRPGKSIGSRFASRYYDSISYGMLLYARNLLDGSPEGYASAICMGHTSFLPYPLEQDFPAPGAEFILSRDDEVIFKCNFQGRQEIENAIVDATEKAHAIEEEARDHAEKILELARMQADNEKDKILGSAGEEVAKLAKDAASKAMFGSPSEAYDSFLKAAEDEK